MTLPILDPSPTESLSERCRRFAAQIKDYESDPNGILEVTEVRQTLERAADALQRLNE